MPQTETYTWTHTIIDGHSEMYAATINGHRCTVHPIAVTRKGETVIRYAWSVQRTPNHRYPEDHGESEWLDFSQDQARAYAMLDGKNLR